MKKKNKKMVKANKKSVKEEKEKPKRKKLFFDYPELTKLMKNLSEQLKAMPSDAELMSGTIKHHANAMPVIDKVSPHKHILRQTSWHDASVLFCEGCDLVFQWDVIKQRYVEQ